MIYLLVIILASITTSAIAAPPTLNGQLRAQTIDSLRSSDDILTQENDMGEFFADGAVDGRLNFEYTPTDILFFGCSYEAVVSGGMTRKTLSDTPLSGTSLLPGGSFYPDDSTQLFSLTGILTEEDEYLAYHRIDRLYVELRTDAGDFSLGRQALTWGNGLVFNPADLVNPFAPADIIRDYKIGSDMVLYRTSGKQISDLQLAYVPRRDRETGEVTVDSSTIGGKMSFSLRSRDIDLYAMRHYNDSVFGGGLNAFVGEALFRGDILVTVPEEADSYVSAVANMDYSWVWDNSNWYGLLEIYYNGLGKDSRLEALADPAVLKRLLRGDLFATGRWYLTGLLRYEAHPLVNISASVILNMDDGSFLLQPRIEWSITSAFQLLAGFNIPAGTSNSEYGSIEIKDSGATLGRPRQLYLVLTWYF